jgi:2-iminobutanoate/2-iminopropanoate deaminase
MAAILPFDPPRAWAAATVVGDLVLLAGETGVDPATDFLASNVAAQAEQAFDNIEATLARLGLGLANVVKLTVYLTHVTDLPIVSAVRRRRLPHVVPSSTIGVLALARDGMLVEIEAVAVLGAVRSLDSSGEGAFRAM